MRLTIFAVILLVAAAVAGLVMTVNESRGLAEPEVEAVAVSGPDRGDSWLVARAAGEGTLRILYVPAPGFAYLDASGELTGVTIELARDFGNWLDREHGVTVDLQFVEEPDWRTFYSRVRDADGGVLGLGNVTITDARREELQFSPPYLTNVAVLITHENVPVLRSMDELATALAGVTPLAFAGTLHEARLARLRDEHLPDADLAEASSNDEIIERVASGGYFAYVDGYNFFRAHEAGAPIRHHPVANDASEEFGIILPLNSDWHRPLAAFFAHDGGYLGNDRHRNLLARHLGQGVADALLEDR